MRDAEMAAIELPRYPGSYRERVAAYRDVPYRVIRF